MTWIVAKQLIMPPYVALFSDIRVTWQNGKVMKDCLKKVYPLANNIAAGFSGSIDIGFDLLMDLNAFMVEMDKKGEQLIPRKIAHRWHRRARKIFNNHPDKYKKLGCSIIMAGASPVETDRNNMPRTDIVIFKHRKNFDPIYIQKGRTASIGSGTNVQVFKDYLASMDSVEYMVTLLNADSRLGGGGDHIAFMASLMLQQNQVAEVSSNIHCTLIRKQGWTQYPLDFTTHIGDDQRIETKMPKVAESYSQYLEMCKTVSLGAGTASAYP